jgi:hypothetical protein
VAHDFAVLAKEAIIIAAAGTTITGKVGSLSTITGFAITGQTYSALAGATTRAMVETALHDMQHAYEDLLLEVAPAGNVNRMAGAISGQTFYAGVYNGTASSTSPPISSSSALPPMSSSSRSEATLQWPLLRR